MTSGRSRAARCVAALLAVLWGALLAGCTSDTRGVRASGTVEMDEIDVASQVGGRVARLEVNEGDSVRWGDTLAVLDRGEISADLEAQRALAERAIAQLQDLRSGPRPQEVQAARAELEAASAHAQLADSELKRVTRLYEGNVASARDLDRARADRDAALARRQAAEEQLRLLLAGSRRAQITAAQKAAEAARAQLQASRSRVSELYLTAPISGVVLLKNFELGELAPAGMPVVTLGKPDSLWMRVYVAAPELPRVRLGAAVEVSVQGIGRRFRGRVVEIATESEFTPRAALTEEERANLVFGVKVALDPTGGVLKAGLPAEATIEAAPLGAGR